MPSSDLIEFHANALALAVLIQAQAKSKDKGEIDAWAALSITTLASRVLEFGIDERDLCHHCTSSSSS
jgi:hypothetical protein